MIIFKDIHTQIYVYICISLDIHVYIDILHNTSYIYFIRIYNTHHIYMCTIYRYIMYTVYVNIRHTLAYTNSYYCKSLAIRFRNTHNSHGTSRSVWADRPGMHSGTMAYPSSRCLQWQDTCQETNSFCRQRLLTKPNEGDLFVSIPDLSKLWWKANFGWETISNEEKQEKDKRSQLA